LAIEDTIWGVHPAAKEVVFLKANFTLLNYLEAWLNRMPVGAIFKSSSSKSKAQTK
jgi:hypothetical protein